MGNHCFEKYEKGIGKVFGQYGNFAANHPWKILLISIFLNGIFGIGFIKLETETNSIVLYTPRNSKALQDQKTLEDLYTDRTGSYFETRQLTDFGLYGEVIVSTQDRSNILRNETLEELYRIDEFIQKIQVANSANQPVSYPDVCARNANGCVIFGGIVLSSSFRTAVKAGNVQWPIFRNKSLTGIFGEPRHTSGRLVFASMVKLRYYLLQDTSVNKTVSQRWEQAFIDQMETIKTNLTDIVYTYSDALDSELQSSTSGDIKFFSVTFVLMITYASIATIATGNGVNCVADRQNLGKAGVLPSALSIVSTFGILCLSGVKVVSIVGVMPFLILGIGIDDMFVLLSGLADTLGNPKYKTTEDRMVRTLQTSGVAITITSLTDGLAFAVGVSSVFNSVRNFCAYTGLAVLICYINQLTIFVPCMVLHEKRVMDNRHQITCRITKTRDESKAENRSKLFLCCCTGDIPNGRQDVENFLEIYPKLFLKKILHLRVSKICIVLMFLGYIAAAVYGVVNLKQGLQLSDLALKDSFYYKHSTMNQEYYGDELVISFVITNPQDYNLNATQNSIKGLLHSIQSDVNIVDGFSISWLDSFLKFNPSPSTTSSQFISNFKTFLGLYPEFQGDVVFDDLRNKIISSRFYVLTKSLKSSTEEGDLMLRMREIADNFVFDCIAYAPAFIYYEQYVTILRSTLQTVGVAVGVMLVITILFMPNVPLVILVSITLVLILLGVFGFMYYWNLTLSSVTMIHLIMSVGFAVDFSAHICHAYLSSEGDNKRVKVDKALDLSGGPIFNAAISSIVGVLMLLASSSYIFQSFFKVMLLVVVFGLMHAVLLLPVVLSAIGPLQNSQQSGCCAAQSSKVSNTSKTTPWNTKRTAKQ